MSQLCPVCRTRLWTDPLFTPRRLTCPRCGAEFRPTVSWFYFRLLLVVVAVLSLVLIALLSGGNVWLLVFVVVLAGLLLLLPRLIDLQHIGPELNPSEGVLEPRQLELELEDQHEAQDVRDERERRFYRLVSLGLGGVALLLVVLILMQTL